MQVWSKSIILSEDNAQKRKVDADAYGIRTKNNISPTLRVGGHKYLQSPLTITILLAEEN